MFSSQQYDNDPTAKLYLQTIAKLEERNEEVLYSYIEDMKDEEIFRGSSTALNLFSLLNLAMWRKDA
jgi:hypothetical protein